MNAVAKLHQPISGAIFITFVFIDIILLFTPRMCSLSNLTSSNYCSLASYEYLKFFGYETKTIGALFILICLWAQQEVDLPSEPNVLCTQRVGQVIWPLRV